MGDIVGKSHGPCSAKAAGSRSAVLINCMCDFGISLRPMIRRRARRAMVLIGRTSLMRIAA
jgi:hypothetical protein